MTGRQGGEIVGSGLRIVCNNGKRWRMNKKKEKAPVSVLMSLYWKENPEYLKQALDSIFAQTMLPDEVVCVLDGPVGDKLTGVLEEFVQRSGQDARLPRMVIVPITHNGGLGKALHEGMLKCSNELIARMDTDDIAKPARIAKQYSYMTAHPEIAACGTWIEEFIGKTDNIISERVTEAEPEKLAEYARMRNPMNHPTVMMRKSAVLKAGNYQHCPFFEDWFLWVRMIEQGMKLANIPECLLSFRASRDMFMRRGGLRYIRDNNKFQKLLYKRGFISKRKAYLNTMVRTSVYMMPCWLRASIYPRFIHRKKG